MIDVEEDKPATQWRPSGVRTSNMSELQIQSAFRARAKIICPAVRIVAIPNGTHIASMAGRAKANREGRSAGFPDVMLIWRNGSEPGNFVPQIAFIEFKAFNGVVKPNQAEWLDWLSEAGFACSVWCDANGALSWIRDLGAPFLTKSTLA